MKQAIWSIVALNEQALAPLPFGEECSAAPAFDVQAGFFSGGALFEVRFPHPSPMIELLLPLQPPDAGRQPRRRT